jgi:hypothetical protein
MAIDRERTNNKLDNKSFKFIWFLITIYHDLGYKYETSKPIFYKTLCDFIKYYCGTKKLDEYSGVPELFNNVYKDYFEYRAKYCKVNDHGISAAHIMYNDLCKMRAKNGWNKSLEKTYNYTAWIILSHNIWFVKNNSNKVIYERYKQYKLDDLILKDDEYKIQLTEYPLLFLFCLVDSIEPVKAIKEVALLTKLSLKIANNQLIITSDLPTDLNDQYRNKVASLNDWLTKTQIRGNKVFINLKTV